jgi:hypothetical protein
VNEPSGGLPVQALDHATGYGVAAAAIARLARRRQTGWGGAARLSLVRTAEELFALPAVRSMGGASVPPHGSRLGLTGCAGLTVTKACHACD